MSLLIAKDLHHIYSLYAHHSVNHNHQMNLTSNLLYSHHSANHNHQTDLTSNLSYPHHSVNHNHQINLLSQMQSTYDTTPTWSIMNSKIIILLSPHVPPTPCHLHVRQYQNASANTECIQGTALQTCVYDSLINMMEICFGSADLAEPAQQIAAPTGNPFAYKL